MVNSGEAHQPLFRGDIKWELTPDAAKDLAQFRREMGEIAYIEHKKALQEFFCEYINSGEQCTNKGCNISPLGANASGGKTFKVRWALPGAGKSGGLRIAMVAYCSEKRVKLAGAWLRREEPSDEDFERAASGA